MLGLTAARMMQSAAGRRRQLELTDDGLRTGRGVVRERLAGGGQAIRAELLAAFRRSRHRRRTGSAACTSSVSSRSSASWCSPARDSWALLDEWVPQPRRLERDEALEEFAFRYFSSHGPATVKDFAWWSSLTLTDARAGLAAARDRLDELEVDGVTYHLRPGLEPAARAVHLLPGFDEYLLGYADRSAPLAREHADSVVPGGNGCSCRRSSSTARSSASGSVSACKAHRVTLSPYRPLTHATLRAIRKRLDRYAEFLGTDVELAADLRAPEGDRAR